MCGGGGGGEEWDVWCVGGKERDLCGEVSGSCVS